jgi:ribosomal protein S20
MKAAPPKSEDDVKQLETLISEATSEIDKAVTKGAPPRSQAAAVGLRIAQRCPRCSPALPLPHQACAQHNTRRCCRWSLGTQPVPAASTPQQPLPNPAPAAGSLAARRLATLRARRGPRPPPARTPPAPRAGILHQNTAARRKARLSKTKRRVLITAGLYTPVEGAPDYSFYLQVKPATTA